MNHQPGNRRDFLVRCAALAGGAVLTGGPAGRAIEPFVRRGAKFKFSLAAYSYRDLLSGATPQLTLDDFIADCAQMGLEGTELTSYCFPPEITPEYLRGLKRRCFLAGLDVSGTAVGNDFCLPPGPQRDAQLALVRQWVDYAEILGAPVIRIFSGSQRPGQSLADAQRLAVEAIASSCRYAGEHGVCLALENHGGLTETADGMLELVRAVDSPWFGVNLDTGNFRSRDVYGDLARLAPFAVNVQVKVVVSPQGEPRQPTDFARLAALLRAADYRGYVVLEYEEDEDPRAACPRHLEAMRQAFLAA